MLADEPRNACFARAIERAVARAAKRRRGEADEEVHVLDIGAGVSVAWTQRRGVAIPLVLEYGVAREPRAEACRPTTGTDITR